MRLIVTRPAAQASGWVQALRAQGLDAQALPLITIAPLQELQPLHAAWRMLPQMALAMFVSANAVAHFFAGRPEGLEHGSAWPAQTLAGSTGPGTSAALRAAGVPETQLVEPPASSPRLDSEALWARLAAQEWRGRQALIVRGEEGRDWLAQTLRQRGAQVHFVAAYRRCAPVPDTAGQTLLVQALAEPAAHLWLFSSSEAIVHLQALCPSTDWSCSRALASHPRIVQAAQDAGFGEVQAMPATPQALAVLLGQGGALQSAQP